ncbi:cytochrome P450 82A3 [Artemisia annua]|uniref:Cytochrome P450 82A3 n=1 Tax=Artemisia annua TaxID=35608 RepID=A0A2U1KXL6_ARTAN|nr:cytochrome P450 82A3 [Artemisia annua]
MEFNISFSPTIAAIFFDYCNSFLAADPEPKEGGHSEDNRPPQSKGAWPIIGHLHLLGSSQPPHKVLGDLAEKYDLSSPSSFGFHQALVVSSREIAKECYTKNDKVFASRPKWKVVEIMGYNYAMFGLAPYGR